MKQSPPLVSYLLSLLVMAWGILPPALHHAHEGGSDTGHRHTAEVKTGEPHNGHHHSHTDDHGVGRTTGTPMLAGDWVAHIHWWLFGIEFSLPTSGKSDDPAERHGTETLSVRLVENLPAVNSHGDCSLGLHAQAYERMRRPRCLPTSSPHTPIQPHRLVAAV